MDLGLEDKRVLITGGTKSVGRAIVDAFVAERAVVGFCARDAKLVKQRDEERHARKGRVQGTALDVTDDPALKKRIDGFATGGGIDHFVANVSALGTHDTREGWRKSIEIDIVSTVESVRHAMPHLPKRGHGATCTVIGTASLNEAGPVRSSPIAR
jgi:NAD(P)-dependent dehydrogenase (short-subunit alcohol dehydrogenase family)